ncbi:MAG TPA: AAA family ATPase, partial [Clostridia bacterium]|nr:AAA family ATPase [Clostridia bacterium]
NLLRFVHKHFGRLPSPGEVWLVSGERRNHPEFGPQVHVSEAVIRQPRGRLLIDFLARHEAFDGLRIGVTKASALYAYFGEDLYDVLEDGNEERLAEVEKLPREIIRPLIEAWQTITHEANVVRWLSGWDCPLSLARKLIDYYGKQAIDKLRDNPYRMLAFTSFKKCDEMAGRLGIAADDPRRLGAVVQHILYQHLEHGHTVMSTESLKRKVVTFLGLMGDGAAERAVAAAQAAKVIVVSDGQVSATGIRMLEVDAMTRFERMLAEVRVQQTELFGNDVALATALAESESEAGYSLNDEQKAAVAMALRERLSIICGGAGVGKTTVLKALAKVLLNEVYFMALTGQAARRITQATGRVATTIEYFLRHIAGNISSESSPLIVVDEASMLDLQLATRILRACPQTARLLLVGDPAQLPPVNFGLIFHKLTESHRVPKTELRIINRQKEESGIPEISRQIRVGQIPSLPGYLGPGTGVSFVSTPREEVIQRLIDVKADLPNAQVLCIKNAGGLGIQDVNEVFHRLKSVGRQTEESVGMSVGEPVIFKKNVADLDLVNGSLGKVMGFETDEDGALQILCSFAGDPKTINGHHMEYLKLAYAITVHSAQGSQFDRVVILVEQSQILDRTLIYTALTRGIRQVVFIGDQQAFEHAVRSEPKASQRSVTFHV